MIKKGMKVKILTGKDKSKEGEVMEIDRKNQRAKVKGINIIKKHLKTTKEKKGGIVSKENFVHLSNMKNIEENIKQQAKNNGTRLKQIINNEINPNLKKCLGTKIYIWGLKKLKKLY